MKQAREKELKYLRVNGVYEKVGERAAVAKYNVTPVDTNWVDIDKAIVVEADASPLTNCGQRVGTGHTCVRELSRWKH